MMLFENARLIDPASGRDEFGALRVRDGLIEEIGPDLVAHDDEHASSKREQAPLSKRATSNRWSSGFVAE